MCYAVTGAWCHWKKFEYHHKSLYMHDSAAVQSSQGTSEKFRCLMGVKQGCSLTTLFGLYVDGLEKHMLDTANIAAPTPT